jgi:hypothetical protein
LLANPALPCPSCGRKGSASDIRGEGARRYRYKVLTQKDKWFSSKFDPTALEDALNAYAAQGWRVISCATAEIPGILGGTNREEMIIIMERGE